MEKYIREENANQCECGGHYIVDDDMWPSRKHCNKCGDYIDISG